MKLIDGDRIVTAQLYDDKHEEFTEKKMSIIDFVNAYTDEGVTTADDVLDKIRAEIIEEKRKNVNMEYDKIFELCILIIEKYMVESEAA